tara:strand:- start:94 stop:816 length:723 start_codon:yes stop_codon:yes gene_type:complete
MKTLAIIPARAGSKGLPDKNIKLLANKPLISYSILAGKKSKLISRVIVSTDSTKYASIAKDYDAEVPFLRPKNISGDFSTDYDFVKHAIDWLDKNENYYPDLIVNLRPVTPLRDPKLIDDAITFLNRDSDCTSLRSAHEMSETAYKMCEIDQGYFKSICNGSYDHDELNKPRQSFPTTYTPNGYVDVMRSSYINKNKLLYGDRVKAFITPVSYEVDSIDDFQLLEWLLEKDNKVYESLFK